MKKYYKPDISFRYFELIDVLSLSGDDKENFGDLDNWNSGDGNV